MAGGALEGIRVVDLTSVVVGPVATKFLADHGADVIKVEAPDGDLLRTLGGASRTGQLSPKFLHLNRNKRSIALDLKKPVPMAALKKLLTTADICVSNMRPKAMKKLGLTPVELQAINPSMICCSIVGFGQGGRYMSKPAYDSILQGYGGLSAINKMKTGVPSYIPMTIADHTVGLIAAQLMLLAIYAREKTGHAEIIEVPMFENIASIVLSEHMGQLSFSPGRGVPGDRRVLDNGSRPLATKDGYICISANTDAQAFAMFKGFGKPELRDDPRFCSVKARYENVSEYFALREEYLLTKTTEEWIEIFEAHDVPCGPSHSLESLVEDKHLDDVGFFSVKEHEDEGELVNIGLPNQSQALARDDYALPPMKSEHGSEILKEIGYSDAEIAELTGSVIRPERKHA